MNVRTFITSLLLAAASSALAAPPTPSQPIVDLDRLVRVYANLKNAEQMATTGIVTDREVLITAARSMPADALKKECAASVDRCLAVLSSSPTKRRPETFAYMKNAMLRLTRDREEPHAGHLEWAGKSRVKLSAAIRECAKGIKDALAKI